MGISIKYVVTDPCYILDNDVWSKCCEVFDKYKDDEFMYQRFDEAVSRALVEYTGYPAFDVSDKNWTVVNIKDNKTQAIISSMNSDFYEEEEDYEL